MNPPSYSQISERAFTLWHEGNCTGDATTLWLDAERQLAAEMIKANPPTPRVTSSADLHRQQAKQEEQAACAPQIPTHPEPNATPAESSKPL